MKHRKQRGLTLIELLVALSIGAFLIIGAVTVQSQTRKTFSVNENQARLQETARFALSVIESDVQLAGLYGYSNNPNGIKMQTADGLKDASVMRADSAKSATGGGVYDDCGKNQVFNLYWPIQAEDGQWKLGCDPDPSGQIPGTDTLTVRHTGTEKVDPVAGRLQLYTHRLISENQRFFTNGVVPGPGLEDDIAEVRDYFMRTYYVAQDSEGRPNLPALRVKWIDTKDGEGSWEDQEVVRGVEDIQIELGVDPGGFGADGAIEMENGIASKVNGNVARYVKPGDDILKSGQVVAVRIWVRVRAEEAEQGFADQRIYKYGSVKDFQPGDGFRRVVMSRTVFLRNSRSYPQRDEG
jgi:type IV pilus assembly protein PilW